MFGSVYKDKKVLVTGITGFKGSWLALWLIKLGAKVYGIADGIPTTPSLFNKLNLEDKLTYVEVDIRDLESIKKILGDISPDFLFHLAAQSLVRPSYLDPIVTFTTNILGTVNILESLRCNDKKCNAIMITSDKCYENLEWTWGYRENDRLAGKDPYSASKSAAELVISSYHNSFFNTSDNSIRLISARAGNVIGGGDWAQHRIIPDCVRAWSNNNTVKIRNPNTTRPWQHVLEPLSGYLVCGQALDAGKLAGEAYNFGPDYDQNHTVIQLLEELSKSWRGDCEFEIINNNEYYEAGLLRLNCDKALTELDWKPVLDFKTTSRFTADWYNSYYNNIGFDAWEATIAQLEEYCSLARIKNLMWSNNF